MLEVLPQVQEIRAEALEVSRSFRLVEQTIQRQAQFTQLLTDSLQLEAKLRHEESIESIWEGMEESILPVYRFILSEPIDGQGQVQDAWILALTKSQRKTILDAYTKLNGMEEDLGKVQELLALFHVGAAARALYQMQPFGLNPVPSSVDTSEESSLILSPGS